MPRGNKDGIIQYRIALPDLSEQRRLADEIANWYEKIENAQNIMTNCSERKKEIIRQYL
jgi:type I restriction enzyme M protein